MTEKLIIPPSSLTFITTYKCTAACKDCCFKCSPKRNERLKLEDMKSYIDQAVQAYPSLKVLVLTGGEPFTLGKDLTKIIEYGSSLGLTVRVVTNGYWAKKYDITVKQLIPLVNSGLKELNFSTGDDHLEFVPNNNIINGASVAMEMGLTTVINVESAGDRNFKSESLYKNKILQKYIYPDSDDIAPLKIINGVWMPFTKTTLESAKAIKKDENLKKLQITDDRCTNLFNIITIDPNYQMVACCGLTSHCSKYLNLGNVKKYSIKELYENQFDDFMKIWLSVDGPHHIAKYISERINLDKPLAENADHMCNVCAQLLNSKECLNIIKDNIDKLYSNIIFKYIFNKKTNNYENT